MILFLRNDFDWANPIFWLLKLNPVANPASDPSSSAATLTVELTSTGANDVSSSALYSSNDSVEVGASITGAYKKPESTTSSVDARTSVDSTGVEASAVAATWASAASGATPASTRSTVA